MPHRNNATKRLHIGLAAFLLAVVGASMVATLSPSEIAHRGRLLSRAFAGDTIAADERTGFWFDPAYEAFLDEVRRRTPRDATIALFVPSYPDVYVYQAAYQLAPRRVVEPRRENEATFVADYGHHDRARPNGSAIALPGGALIRRR
jgi:hypothetical protein